MYYTLNAWQKTNTEVEFIIIVWLFLTIWSHNELYYIVYKLASRYQFRLETVELFQQGLFMVSIHLNSEQ